MKIEPPNKQKPVLVGINHVALEVGNINEALDFYEKIFNFKLRSKGEKMAFLDLGDQFLALFETKQSHSKDKIRHFGLVVDDRSLIRDLVAVAGGKLLDSEFIEFYDPWGNLIQIVEYKDIQFSKTPQVLQGMGLYLDKTQRALDELSEKGMS
jgi:catechol 2,3-dioxygenase-like lactoylglutathione lyase family enzyme